MVGQSTLYGLDLGVSKFISELGVVTMEVDVQIRKFHRKFDFVVCMLTGFSIF